MASLVFFSLLLCLTSQATSKVIPIISEDYEDCSTDEKYFSPDIEMIMINDTLTIVNGTVTTVREFVDGVKAGGYCEQFVRGQWVVSPLARRIEDFCATINNPSEPWYELMKHRDHETCPLSVGSKMYVDEYEINFGYMYFPHTFIGKMTS
jgi:hypothetical protein